MRMSKNSLRKIALPAAVSAAAGVAIVIKKHLRKSHRNCCRKPKNKGDIGEDKAADAKTNKKYRSETDDHGVEIDICYNAGVGTIKINDRVIKMVDFRIISSAEYDSGTTEIIFKIPPGNFDFKGELQFPFQTILDSAHRGDESEAADEKPDTINIFHWDETNLIAINGKVIEVDSFKMVNSADGTTEFMFKINSAFSFSVNYPPRP